MSVKFYICNHCKNIITKMNDSGVPVVCCGEKMTELIPGTSDGAHEKHVPAFEVNGNKVSVKVGSVEHPMMEKHYIQWILIETNFGTHCRSLTPEDSSRTSQNTRATKPAKHLLPLARRSDLKFIGTASISQFQRTLQNLQRPFFNLSRTKPPLLSQALFPVPSTSFY